MKISHYIYKDARKENVELKEWFAETFKTPEAIEAKIYADVISLEGIEGPIEIKYEVFDKPLIVDGHEFELLRDYHVEYTIDDKVFSSKTVERPWTEKRIAEVALVHYATAKTKVFGSRITVDKSKIQAEKELLKSLRLKKLKSKN